VETALEVVIVDGSSYAELYESCGDKGNKGDKTSRPRRSGAEGSDLAGVLGLIE
jgi:hypothetical protein